MTRQEIETRFAATIDAIDRINTTIKMHESAAPKEHALLIEGWKKMRKKVSDNFLNDFHTYELGVASRNIEDLEIIAQAA
jgi:hypothetical protein